MDTASGMVARDKIIEAATRLLSQPATAKFTYESLAQEAGVSRQTLHTQFPNRIDLLVGVADLARDRYNVEGMASAVYDAETGAHALIALVDLHVAFTPKVLMAMRAVELERSDDPDAEKAFGKRSAGRAQQIRLVVRRLQAEQQLDPIWSVETAGDFITSLISATYTFELLGLRGWTPRQLRTRLLHVLESALIRR